MAHPAGPHDPPPYDSIDMSNVGPMPNVATNVVPIAAAAGADAPSVSVSAPSMSTDVGSVGHVQTAPPQSAMRWQGNRQASRSRRASEHKAPTLPAIDTAKKPDDKHTVIAMVVDRSGSMQAMGSEVEGGCNAYLDSQRQADVTDEARTTVILTTFDNMVERVVDGAPLASLPPITHDQVAPRGMTALYDGIGESLRQTIELVNGLPTRPSVAVFILTDGAENASQVWNKEAIAAELKQLQEQHGWDVTFAAANQDAMKEGASMSVAATSCMQWGHEGHKMKSAFTSANVAYQRKKNGNSAGFSAEERAACM